MSESVTLAIVTFAVIVWVGVGLFEIGFKLWHRYIRQNDEGE